MGQITATRNLVATKVVRLAGQLGAELSTSLRHSLFKTKWTSFCRRHIQMHLFENVRILIEISLRFVPEGPINNIPTLAQIMAWRRPVKTFPINKSF